MKKKILSIALIFCLCLGLLPSAALAANSTYTDIQGHWAESAIERWSAANVVEGYDGRFFPDQTLTRGQMAKILANVLGLTEVGENPFADLADDAWYTPYVLRCYQAGILQGDGVNANPDAVLTRQEAMTMLCRALGIAPAADADLSDYADADTVAGWAAPYVAAMARSGIVTGVGENRLDPTGQMTRASIMVMLDRAIPQGGSADHESTSSGGGSSSGGSTSGGSTGGGSTGGGSTGGGSEDKDNPGGNTGGGDENENPGGGDDNDNPGGNPGGGDDNDNPGGNTGGGDDNDNPGGGTEENPQGDGIIHLKGTSIDATGVDGVEVDGTIVTITAVGDYIIEGTLDDGQIVVSDALGKKDAVNITLQGVDVTCSNSAPFNAAGGKIGVTLADGTTNTFTDSGKYTAYTTSKDPKGCFYARRDMDIGGSGTLVVNGNVKNGLVCGADLKIKKGASLTVTAVNNAIKGDNGVEFTNKTGTVTVTAGGDGIKSDAIDTDILKTGAIEADKGYVLIEGGTFTINAEGDGIQADNFCTITGGDLAIVSGTEGIKANEVNLPVLADDAIVEGEYVNGTITISGGTIDITAGEDGIKATERIEISGEADVTVDASQTDATDGSGFDGIQVGKTTETVNGNTTQLTVDVWGTLAISGGTVNIKGASDDAIVAKGDFIMTGGTLTGKATCDFIKAYRLVDISDGTLNITSGQDGIQSGKALTETTSGNTTTSSNYTQGDVRISGGDFTITAGGGSKVSLGNDAASCKGIKANTDLTITGGTFNIDSADDCIHSNYNVTVTGGSMALATGDDGVHADYTLTLGTEGGADDDFTIDISTSYEGIEGSVIKYLSGTTYLYATDDGVNAAGDYTEDGVLTASITPFAGPGNPGGGTGGWGPGGPGGPGGDDSSPYGMLYIKGGRIFCEAKGDGLDSNGNIEMSGGLVLVNGPTSGGNGVFDADGTFKVTGGTLIGVGTSDMAVTPTVSNQGYLLKSNTSGSAGTPVKITTDNGSITFIPKVTWRWFFVTTPDMTSGGSYSLSTVSSYGEKIFGKTVNGTFYGLVESN